MDDGDPRAPALREEPIDALAGHGQISIAFTVESVLDVVVVDGGLGGLLLRESAVPERWVKDYDADDGEGPSRWAERFDVARWGLIGAYDGDDRVGGVVIAWSSPGVNLLQGRTDLAYVWDLRVRPGRRGAGVGTALLHASFDWASARGCREIRVETQNVNVRACRFYEGSGFSLASIDRFAYPGNPGETQLIWRRELPPG